MSSVPLLLLSLCLLIYADISIWLILLTVFIAGILIIYTNSKIHEKMEYQFRSLGNLLDAISRGDYSLRSRTDLSNGELGELINSINVLCTLSLKKTIDSSLQQDFINPNRIGISLEDACLKTAFCSVTFLLFRLRLQLLFSVYPD